MHNLDKLKAQISPGDAVQFVFRGQKLHGLVSRLGPKYARITVSNGDPYRVPYQLIQPLGARKNYSDQEQGALKKCHKLLCKHGLNDWSACLDDSISRAGACKYSARQISLARLFIRKASEQEIRDTILHEIAHALAGIEHHHDAVWRKIAKEIGCTAQRCHDIVFSPPRWIVQCPNGCFANTRNRRIRGVICKKCRQPPTFIPWTDALAQELEIV